MFLINFFFENTHLFPYVFDPISYAVLYAAFEFAHLCDSYYLDLQTVNVLDVALVADANDYWVADGNAHQDLANLL